MKRITYPVLEKGFSLVELMVAMVLGLILIGGVVQVFVSNMQTFHTNNGVARVQESARFALSELAKDIRMAGFKGCDAKGIPIGNITDSALFNIDAGDLFGYDDVNATVATVVPTTNTDVLQIKLLVDEGVFLTEEVSALDSTLNVNDNSKFDTDDILFIGDCEKGTVAKVTGTSGTNEISVANTTTLSPNGSGYWVDAAVYKLEVKTYYIAPSSYENNLKNEVNSLWLKVNEGDSQELVAGVDDLQVLYGEDTDGDLTPNQFREADAVTNMENVSVVRIRVNANSFDSVGNGAILNRDFTLSVTVRNRFIPASQG